MPSPQATFRTRLRAGEPLVGLIVTMPFAGIAEIVADAGRLALDRHGARSALTCCTSRPCCARRAAPPRSLRAPANDPVWIKRILDTGAGRRVAARRQRRRSRAAVDAAFSPAAWPAQLRRVAHAHGYGTAHERGTRVVAGRDDGDGADRERVRGARHRRDPHHRRRRRRRDRTVRPVGSPRPPRRDHAPGGAARDRFGPSRRARSTACRSASSAAARSARGYLARGFSPIAVGVELDAARGRGRASCGRPSRADVRT